MVIVSTFIICAAAVAAAWRVWPHVRGLRPALLPPPSDIAAVPDRPFGADSNVAPDAPDRAATQNTTTLPLQLAPGLSIGVFAKGLGAPRVLRMDDRGQLLVSIPASDHVVALPDHNQDGVADETRTVVSGLDRPHGLAFSVDDGKSLYIAESGSVARYAYDAETMRATGRRVLANLPAGGGHWTRSLLMRTSDAGYEELLVSVGSSCNVCRETDARRAAVHAIEPHGRSALVPFATGLRNAVFLARHPATGAVWVTEMGRDLLGDDLPPDEINILRDGANYGWPYCYGKNIRDPFGKGRDCSERTPSHIDLPAHSAPLGLAFIPEVGWPSAWRHDLLVAYHGSWNRTDPTGYKIVRFDLDATGEHVLGVHEFISGWLTPGGRALGRPVDLLFAPDGALFISDDKAGVVYRVTYDGGGGSLTPLPVLVP